MTLSDGNVKDIIQNKPRLLLRYCQRRPAKRMCGIRWVYFQQRSRSTTLRFNVLCLYVCMCVIIAPMSIEFMAHKVT